MRAVIVIEIGIRHRTASLPVLYSVTVTYIFKVKHFNQ